VTFYYRKVCKKNIINNQLFLHSEFLHSCIFLFFKDTTNLVLKKVWKMDGTGITFEINIDKSNPGS